MNLFAKFESPVELTTAAAIIGAAEKIVKKTFEAEKAKCTISTVYEDVAKGEVAVSKPVEIWAEMTGPDDTPLKPNGEKYKTIKLGNKLWLAEDWINVEGLTEGTDYKQNIESSTHKPLNSNSYSLNALSKLTIPENWHLANTDDVNDLLETFNITLDSGAGATILEEKGFTNNIYRYSCNGDITNLCGVDTPFGVYWIDGVYNELFLQHLGDIEGGEPGTGASTGDSVIWRKKDNYAKMIRLVHD